MVNKRQLWQFWGGVLARLIAIVCLFKFSLWLGLAALTWVIADRLIADSLRGDRDD